MKKLSKFVLSLCLTGALTLSIGLINNKDLNNTGAFALTEQSKVEDGDRYRVVTVEEQEILENNLGVDEDQTLVITAEEQNMVENSTALSGFVSQENGPGFFFEKVK